MPNLAAYDRGFGRRKPGAWAQPDPAHPLARGLKLAALCNEGGGGVLHAWPNTTPLTTTGTYSWGAGRYGTAWIPDGSTGFASVAAGSYPAFTGDVTVAVLVKPTWTGSFLSLLQAGRNTNGSGAACEIGMNSTSTTFQWYYGNGSSYQVLSPASPPASGAWSYVVGTRAGTTMTLYVNGVKTAGPTTLSGSPATNGTGLYVGSTGPGSLEFINAPFDHLYFWNRALSAAEVAQLWNEPFALLGQPEPRRPFRFTAAPKTVFRRTLSPLGTRAGSRQAVG